MIPQVTTQEDSSLLQIESAVFETQRIIEIFDLKESIERRKKFLDGLIARRAKQLEKLVDFKNE